MKKRIIALLLVLIMSVCILSVAAFADSGASTMSARSGSYYDGGYLFYISETARKILYHTICSRYQNSTVYNYVHTVQYILNDFAEYNENRGYDPGDLDGIFGAQTESATAYYQGRKGLSPDGRVGDNTWTSFVEQWVFG